MSFKPSSVRIFLGSMAGMLLLAAAVFSGVKEDLLSMTGNQRAMVVWSVEKRTIEGFDTQLGSLTYTHPSDERVGRPFVTKDGQWVVYSTGFNSTHIGDFSAVHKVHKAKWDGSGYQMLASNGYLCQLWTDANGKEWAIYMNSNRKDFYKLAIDGSAGPTKLISTTNGRADLQLSRDGKRAAWSKGDGHTGLVDMTTKQEICARGGCRSSMSPDNSYRWSHFESSAHTQIEVRQNCTQISNISLSGSSYFPRWTGIADMFAWEEGNGMGPGPRIRVGKFNSSYTGWSKNIVVKSGSSLSHPWARLITGGSTTPPDVAINSFSADKTSIQAGESSQLSWSTSNATSVALNGESVDATGSKTVSPTGTTTYTLTAQGQGGPKTKSVTITVTEPQPPELTAIEVTPGASSLSIGETATFTAQGKDQYGDNIAATISWALSGTGSISAQTGATTTFDAGNEAGSATLTASSGTVSKEITLTVVDPSEVNIKINCGGAAEGEWLSDGPYADGGSSHTFSCGQIEGNSDLPSSVANTVRHTNHKYDFANVPDGDYTVAIYFLEGNESTARKMDYTIEGEQVISGLSIYDEVGKCTVLKEQFNVTVADGNGLQIVADAGAGNDVFESAISISSGFSGTVASVLSSSAGPAQSKTIAVHGSAGLFTISVSGDNSASTFEVLSLNGRIVQTLNSHSGEAVTWRPTTSGMYIVRAKMTGGQMLTRGVMVSETTRSRRQ